MPIDPQAHARFVGEVINLITGTTFINIGLVVLVIAVIRRRTAGARALCLVGIWSAIYGLQRLNDCSFLIAILPHRLQVCVPYSHAAITYLTLVAGALTFRELTLGRLRQFTRFLALVSVVIAVVGIGNFVRTGDEETLIGPNNLLAATGIVVLLVFLLVPRLSRQYGVVQDRRVMLAGFLIFGVEALLNNFLRLLDFRLDTIWGDLGFGAFLLSLGYVAMQRVYAGERRLASIDNELAIARQLQFSILPTTTPDLRKLRIAAVYEPMTEVAGDFYEYLPADDHHAGFFVADVSGHGVPAALIASMIKVAAKSVATFADNPSELLRRLRDIMSAQLQGQFVSAAYLWIDTKSRIARYSAAGHPPLMFFSAAGNSLSRIESNGLLLGVPIESVFPTCEIPFAPGDRFLLYTDGLTEPENATGEAFGDRRVEQLLREDPSLPAAELSLLLLSEVRCWQPASTPQQDDITFLVIDVL